MVTIDSKTLFIFEPTVDHLYLYRTAHVLSVLRMRTLYQSGRGERHVVGHLTDHG